MSSFVSHQAGVGLVLRPPSFGHRDFEDRSGTWDRVPLKYLTPIASLEVGSAHRDIRSIPDLLELNSMRYMEPAVRTQAEATKPENWTGSVDVVNMDARDSLVTDSAGSDQGSDSVGLHWDRE